MGRGTYETLSGPLPNRRNVVASRTAQVLRQGFELLHDVDTFLRQPPSEAVWIIGGAALFESTLDYCDELYLTRVQGDFGCDRFFPAFADRFTVKDHSDWLESNGYTYQYVTYTKNR
jgi:dihydrofolate reductase